MPEGMNTWSSYPFMLSSQSTSLPISCQFCSQAYKYPRYIPCMCSGALQIMILVTSVPCGEDPMWEQHADTSPPWACRNRPFCVIIKVPPFSQGLISVADRGICVVFFSPSNLSATAQQTGLNQPFVFCGPEAQASTEDPSLGPECSAPPTSCINCTSKANG